MFSHFPVNLQAVPFPIVNIEHGTFLVCNIELWSGSSCWRKKVPAKKSSTENRAVLVEKCTCHLRAVAVPTNYIKPGSSHMLHHTSPDALSSTKLSFSASTFSPFFELWNLLDINSKTKTNQTNGVNLAVQSETGTQWKNILCKDCRECTLLELPNQFYWYGLICYTWKQFCLDIIPSSKDLSLAMGRGGFLKTLLIAISLA